MFPEFECTRRTKIFDSLREVGTQKECKVNEGRVVELEDGADVGTGDDGERDITVGKVSDERGPIYYDILSRKEWLGRRED